MQMLPFLSNMATYWEMKENIEGMIFENVIEFIKVKPPFNN